mgnify:FL=1
MLFYEFQVKCNLTKAIQAASSEDSRDSNKHLSIFNSHRKRERWLSDLNDALREVCADAMVLLFIDRILPNGFHMCAALNQMKAMTAGQLGKKLAPLLAETCDVQEIAIHGLREVTREQFVHRFEVCDKKNYINICNPFYEMNLNYADSAAFQLTEEILRSRPRLSHAQANLEAEGLLADSSFLAELARIYAEENERRMFYGHPVHYHIAAGNSEAAMAMTRLLARALHANKRLVGQRINRIHSIKDTCFEEEDLEHLLHHAKGGAVVIEMCGCSEEEENYAGSYERVVEYFGKIIRKYQRDTLFILVEFHTQTRALKKLLAYLQEDISFVHIEEGAGNRAQAAAYLQKLDTQSSMPHYSVRELELALGERHTFRASDIHQIHEKLYRDALTAKTYRAYQDIDFYKDTITKKSEQDAKVALQEMIGLKRQKELVRQIVASFAVQKRRTELDMDAQRPSMHMCFTGNPGSAKTTVARLLADILSKENILDTGHFVECGRADLVGRYVGWTAVHVKEKFRAARGGILFIDEAYALMDDRSGSYGDEAINTIVQEMENRREDVIVIFAGYPKKMEAFLATNEGLRSRIAFHVDFPDYTPAELAEILRLIARKKGCTLTEEIVAHCRKRFEAVCRKPDFGNGRFVRNVFEQALMRQAQRLCTLREGQTLAKEDLRQLTIEDFDVAALQAVPSSPSPVGFSVS